MRKEDFPILKNRDMAYLDSGATTQKPQKVLDAVESFYEHENANPHRGAYSLSIEATEAYESTRGKIAKFINARYPEEIIFSSFDVLFTDYTPPNLSLSLATSFFTSLILSRIFCLSM